MIFLSYTSVDKDKVLPYYDALKIKGYDVWMDVKCLLGGQNWDFEIKKAFEKSSIVLLFLSTNLSNKRGYIQREVKLALDNLNEKLYEDIYIIPIKLDGSGVLDQLKGIQYISAIDSFPIDDICASLDYQIGKMGAEKVATQEASSVSWSILNFKEEWDGLPGYEVQLNFINISSSKYNNIGDISDIIKGELKKALLSHRENKLNQSGEYYSYINEKYTRINTYEAICSEPKIIGRIVSIMYSVHWYGAGAAHPNHHFEAYNFILDPLVMVVQPQSIFKNQDDALAIIQQDSRLGITEDVTQRGGSLDINDEWLVSGTQKWESFSTFTFSETGLVFHFMPYTVGPYAIGSFNIEIKYERLVEHMNIEYVNALEIQHIFYARRHTE